MATLLILVSPLAATPVINTGLRIVAASTLMATPVALPATYYYHKTERAKQTDSFIKKDDQFRFFCFGTVLGSIPYFNLSSVLISTAITLAKTYEWAQYKDTNVIIPNATFKSMIAGIASGLSPYVTIPCALHILRKGR